MTNSDYYAQLESIWRQMCPRLEWAEGFVLVVLFASHPAPVADLRKRFAEMLAVDMMPLRTFELTDPLQVDDLLTTILFPRQAGIKNPPIWLDMWESHGSEEERQVLRSSLWQLLSRLNERRFLLERDTACPLVLVLPSDLRPDVPWMIPDLWAVRSVSADLPAPQ